MSILKYPFVKLAIALMAAQTCYDFLPAPWRAWCLYVLPGFLLVLLLLRVCCWRQTWYWHKVSYVLFWLFLALLQLTRLSLRDVPNLRSASSLGSGSSPVASSSLALRAGDDYVSVALLSQPVEKPNSWQCAVRVLNDEAETETETEGGWLGRLGRRPPRKCQLYLAKDSAAAALRCGDVLQVRCRWQTLDGPSLMGALPDSLWAGHRRHPRAFDYHQFMRRQGFVATAYVPSDKWSKWEGGCYFPVRRAMEGARHWLVQRYRHAGIEGEGLWLLSALIFGYRLEMDEAVANTYAAAGVTHILAVSGMHVGIICQLLGWLLFFMQSNKILRIVKYLLLIVLLWAYALLTGFSASVLRAVLMFTVSAIGMCLHRKAYAWNSLGFAASVMLLANPNYWYQVGFQLSFLAVAAILAMQPYFQKFMHLNEDSVLHKMMTGSDLIEAKPRRLQKLLQPAAGNIGRYLLELLVLSLAAQIGTAPLSVYYFHQFSNYFLLSNLLMVPWSLWLTYLGLLQLLLADVAAASVPLAALLNYSLQIFYDMAAWVSHLPGALSQHLYPGLLEMSLLYLLLFALFRLAQWGKLHYYIEEIFHRIKTHSRRVHLKTVDNSQVEQKKLAVSDK